MMVTKSEFFTKKPLPSEISLEYARVAAFNSNGEPLLQFMGETTASSKIYSRMRHYSNPKIGDRVLVLNDIILGTWTNAK